MIGGPLHVCEICDVRHYDNCPDCFGFGVYAEGRDGYHPPLTASDGLDAAPPEWIPCPTCKSTPAGIPA